MPKSKLEVDAKIKTRGRSKNTNSRSMHKSKLEVDAKIKTRGRRTHQNSRSMQKSTLHWPSAEAAKTAQTKPQEGARDSRMNRKLGPEPH